MPTRYDVMPIGTKIIGEPSLIEIQLNQKLAKVVDKPVYMSYSLPLDIAAYMEKKAIQALTLLHHQKS